VSNTGTAIEIKGVKATTRALKEFAPELRKDLNRAIRRSLDQVKRGAEGRYPNGSWSIRINNKKILGSLGTMGGRSSDSWADADPGVRAAIFEFAGSTGQGKSPQAQAMIESLNNRYGQPGRFLWDAWDDSGDLAKNQIRMAVKNAERQLQAKLTAMGEAF